MRTYGSLFDVLIRYDCLKKGRRSHVPVGFEGGHSYIVLITWTPSKYTTSKRCRIPCRAISTSTSPTKRNSPPTSLEPMLSGCT